MSALATTTWLAIAGLAHRRGRTAMCIVGVAAGVALAVAVRAQTTSLTHSRQPLERALAGRTTVEAVARGPAGMPVSTFRAVARLPAVDAVAPVSVDSVLVEGPRGRSVVLLVGVDRRLERMGTPIGATVGRALDASDIGLYLPADLARGLGLRPGDRATVSGPAGRRETTLSHTLARLGDRNLGSAPIALAPLGLAQGLTGGSGRITRLLIQESSRTAAARRALRVAVGPGVDLRAPGWESAPFAQATRLYRIWADLFSVLCLLLGAIVVYAVTLLAAVDRRREIATLAALGCAPAGIVGVLVCEAVAIGATGGAAGTALGWWLVHALGASPAEQLSFAFGMSDELRLGGATAAAGVVGGIATAIGATVAANASLVTESPASALAAPTESRRSTRWPRLAGAGGATALLVAGYLTMTAPGLGIVALCLVSGGVVLLVPGVLGLLLGVIERAVPRPGGAGSLGIAELRCAPARSSAMAAVVAAMVIGIVVMRSTNSNLERSADGLAKGTYSTSDLWATAAGNDPWLSRPIAPQARDALRGQPGVARVRSHRTVVMDWQGRRVFVLSLDTGDHAAARVASDVPSVPVSAVAQRAVAAGTGVLMSRDLARAHHVAVGDPVAIPTPSGPRELPIAGFVSNYGWPGGVIQLTSAAIGTWWREPSLTAFRIDLTAGTDASAARARLQAVAAPIGLEVDTPALLRRRVQATTRAGLAPLTRLSSVLTLAGVLALGVSLVAAIMQRARRLATLHAIGIQRRQVVGSLVAESAASTLAGVLAGLAGGLVAHRLAIDYLVEVNGTPVDFRVEPAALGLAVALAVAAAAVVPLLSLGWLSRIPPRNSFADV